MKMTHVARLLGLEESECMIFEAWVPPTPGTNGEVLFFAIWCLLLKNRKKPSEYILDKSVKSKETSPTTDRWIISPFCFLNLDFLASSHHGAFVRVVFSVSSAVLPPSGLKAYFRPCLPLMANNTSLEMKFLINLLKFYSNQNSEY